MTWWRKILKLPEPEDEVSWKPAIKMFNDNMDKVQKLRDNVRQRRKDILCSLYNAKEE